MQRFSCCGIISDKKVLTFSIKDGVKKVVEMILAMKSEGPIIVGVAGGSSSGKSFFAEELLKHFPEKVVRKITIDDYYVGRDFSEKNKYNFDQPQSLDLDLLKINLEELKDRKSTRKPVYSFIKDGGKRVGYETIEPVKVIIVEGLFALRPEIAGLADLRIFVKADCHGRFVRRMMRDINRTSWESKKILEYFLEIVEPMHRGYIDCQEAIADVIIDNPYDPILEPEHSCSLKEKQMKVQMDSPFLWDNLRRVGVELLAESVQEDFYYVIPQQGHKGEILRIRKEGDSLFFTYKALNVGAEIRTKSKFEFPIDESGRQRLEEMCQLKLRILKRRSIYALGNIVFSQDCIFWRGKNYYFLEVRGLSGEKAVRSFLKKVGLNDKPTSRESYLEVFGGKHED